MLIPPFFMIRSNVCHIALFYAESVIYKHFFTVDLLLYLLTVVGLTKTIGHSGTAFYDEVGVK